MRINKIRALILIIFQVLKYAHFSVYRKCDENLFGMLSLDANSSQCIINQGEYSQQSEINNLSPYFVTPYCLGFQYSAGYSASFLTGINCLSNNQLIISYNAPRKIVKTYFEISLFFEYLDHSSSTLDIKTYVNINGIEYWTSSQYTNIQSDIFQNVAYYLQTSNMNQNTLKIEVTPFNLVFNKKQYQIFIKYILLAVQLDCPNNCTVCNNFSFCQQCDSGFYYLQNTNQCLQCDSPCKTCDQPGQKGCLSCGSSLFYQQDTKQCLNSCNSNSYPNSQKVCILCDNSCVTCDGGGPNSCLSCKSDQYYQISTKQCLQCDSTCKTCDKAGQNGCLSCGSSLFYQQDTKQCLNSCNSNSYPNSQKVCILCDNSCATCDGSGPNSCLTCKANTFFFNKMCVSICPNGFKGNLNSLTCDPCENYLSPQCNLCYPSCQLCSQQYKPNQCQTCYSETRQMDSTNNCVCKNPKDQRSIFYQCSYKTIAVIDANLSATSPLLTIDLGSPLKNLVYNTPQSLCQLIFNEATMDKIGLDSQCQISGSQIIVNLSDSSTIMENDFIFLIPNKLQFQDENTDLIQTFYRNVVFQNSPGSPQLQFSYNHLENSCNPLNITLFNLQNDAGRKFMSLNWTLVEIIGSISNEQLQNIKGILSQSSQSKNTTLFIDPKYIPSNINITIQFSFLLKTNKSSSQFFNILYQKQKFISVSYQQSVYPPIFRYMNLSFYFNFQIEICELGQITYFNEPIDLQLVSYQLKQQVFKQYNQSSFQYDIMPYTLASNQTFNVSLILNLSSDNTIIAYQNISVDIQITDLYLQIIGGSSFIQGFKNKMVLNTDSRDYEIQDPNSPQGINFKWICSNLSSIDHICYDFKNKPVQLQQGVGSITLPENTFQPYTIIQLIVIAQKDSRQSSFTATCIFTELNIPPLQIQFQGARINQKTNLNDDLSFFISYGDNVSSDSLSYAGAIIYNNDAVAAIQFDYFQVKLRIWNYFQNIDPSQPTIQIRFSVYNPLFVMPSLSTVNININIPPQNCILQINPFQGIALQTVFEIQFLNCKDDDLPLTYQFFYYNSIDDVQQEFISPLNIVRRQIQDQTLSNTIQTVLPQGNLVIMSQIMDSQLGVTNSTSIIEVQAQNGTVDEYYKYVNSFTQNVLSSSNVQITSKLVTLSIIAEDISKSAQSSQELKDLGSLLIQNIQQLSLQIPKFSLLSTFANKVIAQLTTLIFSSSQQKELTVEKSNLFKQLQTIVQNTNQSVQDNSLSHLQQNNDIQIQNLVDSFKILNSSVALTTNNSQQDLEYYDVLSSQIGNLITKISLPNQGQMILYGNLSTLLSDKVTQKNLFKYVLNVNDSDSENQTSVFSISRNNYRQNIYENTPDFQAYTQQFKNLSQTFTYSRNELISAQIYNSSNSSSQQTLNESTIIYNFNNINISKQYNMTCLQQNYPIWSKQNCNIVKNNQNNYICFCQSQLPTTIIEDVEDMILKNKNLQTAFGEQGFLNLANFDNFYMYIVFWLLTGFTLIQIILFVVARFLDKYSEKIKFMKGQQNNLYGNDQEIQELQQQQKQENIEELNENSQIINDDDFKHSPFPLVQQIKINENNKLQSQLNQPIFLGDFKIQQSGSLPNRRKRNKFLNFQKQESRRSTKQSTEQNIIEIRESKNDFNQLKIVKSDSSSKSGEKIQTQTNSQPQISDEALDQDEIKKINVYLQLSKLKQIAIFHQFFGIFYIFDSVLSRPLRLTLLYIKIIHTLTISILFQGYNALIQQVIIALINSSIIKIAFFGITLTYKKGSICKHVSLILQITISLAYYYIILAVSSGKTPSESNQFIILFLVSFLTEMVFTELIKSVFFIYLIKKYFKQNKAQSLNGQLFKFFDIKQTILNIDI